MAVIKRGKRYQVRIRGLHGKVWSLTCDTRRQGEAVEREMRDHVTKGQIWQHPRARGNAGKASLEDVITAYLVTNAPRWRARTIKVYGDWLAAFNEWFQRRKLTLIDLDDKTIGEWISDLAVTPCRRGLRASTSINSAHASLLSFWRWASDESRRHGWTIEPYRRVRVKSPTPRITFAPTWSEMDQYINELRPHEGRGSRSRYRCAVIQRFTGGREGEVWALTWSDLNLATAEVRFRPETTKGGYGGRLIPMSSAFVAEVKTWAQDDARVCSPATASTIRNSIKAHAWERSGVRPEVWRGQTSHALRKGVVTGLYRLWGGSPQAIEVLVGHQIDSVRAPYIDLKSSFDLRALVEMIPPLALTTKGMSTT